jgi:hypothetical protein
LRTRLLVTAAVLALTVVPAACGDDDDSNTENAEEFGPQGTVTGDDSGCVVSTNGFVAEPGTVTLRFVNDHDAPLTIELVGAGGEAVASAEDLAPGDDVTDQYELEAGEYTGSCSDGTLTWTSDGEGDTPSGVSRSSPAFTVGSE